MSDSERKSLDTKVRYLREELARLKQERRDKFRVDNPHFATWIVTFDWDPGTNKNGAAVFLNGGRVGFIEEISGMYLVYRTEHDDTPLVPKATNLLGKAVGILIDCKLRHE